MSIWYAKNNVVMIPIDNEEKQEKQEKQETQKLEEPGTIILNVKYSNSVPDILLPSEYSASVKDWRNYKKYNTYEKVKKYRLMKRSSLKINEIITYFDIEPKHVLLINASIDLSLYKSIKNHDKLECFATDEIPDPEIERVKYDLVIANGSLKDTDSSTDEGSVFHLLLKEVCEAVYSQEKSGVFILRIFGITQNPTLQLIETLSKMYSEVYIFKPRVSRDYSSEKYIVCKNFNGITLRINDSSSKKIYIKDIFYKKDHEIRSDIIKTLFDYNNNLNLRKKLCLNKPDIDVLQNRLASEYHSIFFGSRVLECKHIFTKSVEPYQCKSCYATILN